MGLGGPDLKMMERLKTYGVHAAVSGFLLLTAWVVEHGLGLQPCLICILQRMLITLSGVVALLGVLRPVFIGRVSINAVVLMVSYTLGLLLACRHVWLLFFVESTSTACLPGFDFIVKYYSWGDFFTTVINDPSSCSEHTHWIVAVTPLVLIVVYSSLLTWLLKSKQWLNRR